MIRGQDLLERPKGYLSKYSLPVRQKAQTLWEHLWLPGQRKKI
jgi:hypothetical protein